MTVKSDWWVCHGHEDVEQLSREREGAFRTGRKMRRSRSRSKSMRTGSLAYELYPSTGHFFFVGAVTIPLWLTSQKSHLWRRKVNADSVAFFPLLDGLAPSQMSDPVDSPGGNEPCPRRCQHDPNGLCGSAWVSAHTLLPISSAIRNPTIMLWESVCVGGVPKVISQRAFSHALSTEKKWKEQGEKETMFCFYSLIIPSVLRTYTFAICEMSASLGCCARFFSVSEAWIERELQKYLIWNIVNASPNWDGFIFNDLLGLPSKW